MDQVVDAFENLMMWSVGTSGRNWIRTARHSSRCLIVSQNALFTGFDRTVSEQLLPAPGT
jgi:hypothetical protein